MAEIALFDLDGVLVRPGGYRAAVRLTLQYFFEKFRFDAELLPSEEEIGIFESVGITGEWDMVPLWLSAILNERARTDLAISKIEGWQPLLDYLQSNPVKISRPDFSATIRKLGESLLPGKAPSESAFAVSEKLYPALRGSWLIQSLLIHTRDVRQSWTTQVLQGYILGHQKYQEHWNQPCLVESQSTLEEYDKPNLESSLRDRLIDLRTAGKLCFSAFTARPSVPPDTIDPLNIGCTPEAEIAWRLVGFNGIPIVGYGAMQWLAERAGVSADHLLKPDPVQALAGLATACSHSPQIGWVWAYNLAASQLKDGRPYIRDNSDTIKLPIPNQLTLHVFEDSPNGIRSASQARELLTNIGVEVDLHKWGIAHQVEKKTALQREGAVVFENINQAVRAAWPQWF